MEKNTKLKLNDDELKKIHQERLDIIEKELLQIEGTLKDLEKNPDDYTIRQRITLLEKELEITKELKGVVIILYQSDN